MHIFCTDLIYWLNNKTCNCNRRKKEGERESFININYVVNCIYAELSKYDALQHRISSGCKKSSTVTEKKLQGLVHL